MHLPKLIPGKRHALPRPPASSDALLLARLAQREAADRREAIQSAIAAIGPGDVVLIAGKGHETGQIVGDTVHPFSDQEEAVVSIRRVRGDG